jgi:GWxTD domain-containing protein
VKKRSHKIFLSGVVLTAVVSFFACYTANKVSTQNIVDIYKNDVHSLHPQFTLLHVNDTISLLYFKIDESELLYERKALSDSFSASVKIYCRVTVNYESPIILDSNSADLNFESASNNKKEFAVGSIPLKLNRGGKYLVTVSTNDVYSKRNDLTYIEANKADFLGKQNFLVRDPANGHILFSGWFDTITSVSIQCFHPVNKLYVSFYRNKFSIAAPPFSTDDYDSPRLMADSTFSIPAHNGLFPLTLKSKGMYHIMADSGDLEGLTLYHFDNSFPYITEAYQMVTPLRYVSSNDEFQRLISSKNPKQDVDNFWLTASSGNKDRAKELIRSYYNRIQDANNYFTSFEEGWKTDRGMIYLIFGPPNSIYRSSMDEIWTYGEERNYSAAITFTFIKLDNPFSDNDYALQRASTYRNLWYNAVDLWREGRVY